MNELKLLFKIINFSRQVFRLLLFSIFVSLIEFIGLALLVPYITVSTNDVIPDNRYIKYIVTYFHINDFSQLIIYLSILMIIFYILRFIINVYYQFYYIKYINKVKHIVMISLYNHYIQIPYIDFVKNNSSNIKKLLYNEPQNIQIVMQSLFVFLSELTILFLLVAMLFYVDALLAVTISIVFLFFFLVTKFFLSKKIEKLSEHRLTFSQKMIQNIDEMLNNFKFIKLTNAEENMKNDFYQSSFGIYSIGSKFEFLSQLPKIVIETIGMIIIVSIIYYLVSDGSSQNIIAIIGIYAVAFYRALPSLHKIMNSYNNFSYYKSTINLIDESLQHKKEHYKDSNKITFNKFIVLRDIVFSYVECKKNFFKEINLIIKKGDRVAFIGESGSGKSTLIDIIMGVLKLSNGSILVDGCTIDDSNIIDWRKKFGYIPQEIYLFDATVAENIVFGRTYNKEKIIKVLKQANIYNYLLKKEGIYTIVGEGGIQLSGGQKQRIGIARALYNDPEILVLDEATSALDNDTEIKIMKEIEEMSKDKTLIIVAHRLSTIEICNVVYKLEDGIITNVRN